MRFRRALDQHVIDQLQATVATQQEQIDQLTRTVASLRLIAKALLAHATSKPK